jgi:WD40 repeat protein
LLSAGLDTKARLWDLRVLSSHDSLGRNSGRKESGVKGHVQPMIQPVAYYEAGRSINSAFFSPSGKFVVSTTQMDRLDILQDIHLAAATFTTKNKVAVPIRVEPVQSIRHDNKTGRWLSTVIASWHAVHDVFCVGSMEQPRVMEVFSLDLLNNNKSSGDQFGRVAIGGDAMTAVTSRCCFHSRGDQLIVVGGTSSGRVALSR